MARRAFQVIDVVEVLQHWHAGRPKTVVAASLGVDVKTIRKYVAAAEAEGIRPGDGLVSDPAAGTVLAAARDRLAGAAAASRATPSHLPLHQVRPDARLLDEDRKLLTHAIRMAAYNAESTLARMLRPHYSRADDEARALLREAFTLSGDLHISGDTLHVRLNPATAPRRSRALHALCQQLTETGTRYPDTNLTISYSVKGQPDTP